MGTWPNSKNSPARGSFCFAGCAHIVLAHFVKWRNNGGVKTWLRSAAVIALSFGVFSDASALESPQSIGFFCGAATTSISVDQFYIPDGQCTYLSPTISGSRYGDIYRGTFGSSTLVNGHSLGFNATSSPQSGDVIPNGVQGEDVFVAVFPAQFVNEFRTFFQTGAGTPPSNNYGFLPFKWGTAPAPEPEEPDPVIIIPGILGSQQDGSGEWVIDPILHTYDDLIATLDVNHYTPGVDLFTFPYNWRKSNVETAVLLKQKIDEVKSICACEKVDLVAHSMGGLVARQYIQSDAYEQDVDQLIFLGTPHLGAPKAYLMWEGGEFAEGNDFWGEFAEKFLEHEAYEKGYPTLFAYIRTESLDAIRNLLPTYSYIFDYNSLRPYPSNYPSNSFLESLNGNIESLVDSGVEIHNFIGDLQFSATITGIHADSEHDYSPMWEHGYPNDFYQISGEHGLVQGSGDGTVPLPSAAFVGGNTTTKVASHNAIVEDSIEDVYLVLTGDTVDELIDKWNVPNAKIVLFQIFSPVDVLVTAPDGKKVGKQNGSDVNEITGAFYSGSSTEVEYITIFNPVDGEYKVTTQGTGDGIYAVKASYISNLNLAESGYTGTTTLGKMMELTIGLDSEQSRAIEFKNPDIDAPVISITSPLSKDYARSETLLVDVSAEDASGVPILETRLETATIPNRGAIDLFFQKLGTSTISASSTDIFGNSTTSSRAFRIIATASSTLADFERAYALGWMTKKTHDGLRQKIKGILVIRKVVKNIVQTLVETGSNGKKISKKVQKKIETSEHIVDKVAAKAFLKELDKHRGNGLDERAYQILKEDVTWLVAN